jgi:hypothetical protein
VSDRAGAIVRQVPGEHRLAQLAVPSIFVTVFGSLVSLFAAEVFAVIWALLFVVVMSLRLLTSKRWGGSDAAVVAGCYWCAIGFVACVPKDSFVAVAIGLIVWTSARPGHEWLPWPRIYSALAAGSADLLTWVADAPLWMLLAASTIGVGILTVVLGDTESFIWFAVIVLVALLLLALTTAGEPIPATRALGRIAIILACLAWAMIAPWRIILFGGCGVLALVSWSNVSRPLLSQAVDRLGFMKRRGAK